jgi:integrase
MKVLGNRERTITDYQYIFNQFVNTNNLVYVEVGAILKNHKFLKLPIDKELEDLLKILINQNDLIRDYYLTDNSIVFITQNGIPINDSKSSANAITKQLHKYSVRYGLENINPHSIRRGYEKGVSH